MAQYAFDVFPLGRYYCIPNDTRYEAASRLMREFRARGLKNENNYSILLYHSDQVTVEIASDQKLAPNFFEDAMRTASRTYIVAWQKGMVEQDPQMLKLKLLATALREEASGGNPFVSELMWDGYRGWSAKIADLRKGVWGTNTVLLFFAGGIAELEAKGLFGGENGLVHLIVNALDPAAEPAVMRACSLI